MSIKLLKSDASKKVAAFNPPSVTSVASAAGATNAVSPNPSVPKASPPASQPSKPPFTKPTQPQDTEVIENLAGAAAQKADQLVRAARSEAERLVQEAQARAHEIERQAREQGFAEAQALAQTQVQAEVQLAVEDLRARLATSLEELENLRAELAARAEQDLVRLALEIAKKIVQREVKVDHEIALTLTRVALSRLRSRTGITVRLHPDDFAYVSERRARLGSEATLELVEDRSISPGGCIVQSDKGEIDARIEQQFAAIEQDFLQ